MEDEGYLELREWTPLTELWRQIPVTITKSLILQQEVQITCISAVDEFLALGSNVGVIFWYNRAKKVLTRLKCDTSYLTCIRIVSSVEYLVAAGDKNGNLFVHQIPKEHPEDLLTLGGAISTGKRQIERILIKDVHKVPVKCVEWSKNGMKLFSGDKAGVVVMTEFDFIKRHKQSTTIFNEAYEIVQLRFQQPRLLLISSIFRTVICQRDEAGQWKLQQVGKKDRKLLSICGATFLNKSDQRSPAIVCSRPGGRFWIADTEGTVQKTLVFKDIFEANRPEVTLLNPSRKFMKIANEFQLLFPYLDDFCVTYNDDSVFVLNLKRNRVEATVKYLRGVIDVTVSDQEIFIIEGPRSIIRIAPIPDQFEDVRSPIFNRDLNSSINSNGMEGCSSSGLEEKPSEECDVAECRELSPIEHLDVEKLIQDLNPPLNVEEHNKKLEIFNQINSEQFDENILFRSRRLKVIEATSPGSEENKGIVEIAQLAKEEERKDDDGVKDQARTDPEDLEASDTIAVSVGIEEQLIYEGPATNIQPEEVLQLPQESNENEDKVTEEEMDDQEDENEEEEEEQRVLLETLKYSMRFLPEDGSHVLVNGMTSSWKGSSPRTSPMMLLEAVLLHEVKDLTADVVESDQGYYEEQEEELENPPTMQESTESLDPDWVIVRPEDCEEDCDLAENWEIIDHELDED